VLHHLYPKPDVTDLVDALRGFGADIDTTSAGSLIVYGRGNGALCHDVCHTLVPDLIEVVTWICAGVVLSSSPLRITGTDMARACSALAPELAVLDEMGVQFDMSANEIMVHPAQALRAVDVTAASHGVFSDNQPFLALLAAYAHGTSKITDTVWPDRFGYLSGLVALGVDMCRRGPSLRVHGPCPPKKPGQRIHATDLRAAAVLLLAALAVPGPTTITGTHHLARGYPDLSAALCAFGADIQPMEEDRQPVPGMPAHPGERQTELARCVHCGDPPPPIHTDPTDTDIPTFRR
jgi:UDP-N-acetylglucosamine enolpyruvyl transferase